jgi:hypothetical protein
LPRCRNFGVATSAVLGHILGVQECEWCGTRHGSFEVHYLRKLKDLEGKST